MFLQNIFFILNTLLFLQITRHSGVGSPMSESLKSSSEFNCSSLFLQTTVFISQGSDCALLQTRSSKLTFVISAFHSLKARVFKCNVFENYEKKGALLFLAWKFGENLKVVSKGR